MDVDGIHRLPIGPAELRRLEENAIKLAADFELDVAMDERFPLAFQAAAAAHPLDTVGTPTPAGARIASRARRIGHSCQKTTTITLPRFENVPGLLSGAHR